MASVEPRISARGVCLLALVALASACKVDAAGQIPCDSDSNCPGEYGQCIGATATAPGRCAVTLVGTPTFASSSIVVSPASFSGGEKPQLTLALPALSGDVNLARSVTLGVSSGGAAEPVTKTGGAAVTLADLGTTITVDAPSTNAAGDATFTYSLTASNAPGSTATATSTGTAKVVPVPVLASAAIGITPASITGGLSPTVSLVLPALTSAASSAATVSLTVAGVGCGAGPVTKSGGGSVGVADLGTTVAIAPPASVATDNKACSYTLTVSNSAATPATASATGALAIAPLPVISSASFAVAPGFITGGFAPTLSATLPSLTSPAAPGTTATLAISGCGTGTVSKSGGGTVSLADLGTTISFAAPASIAADDKSCTYTLTVSNSSTTATATGTLRIVPRPVLAAGSFTLAPAAITGSFAPTLGTTLPALTSPASSASTVNFAISNCGTGSVAKSGGGAVGVADLNTAITFAAPTTVNTDNKTCTYTLSVSNSATTPATATATGTLLIAPRPALASASLLPAPAAVTGGSTAGATLSIPLPANTVPGSTGSVSFTVDSGSGPVPQLKHLSGAVGAGDLGTSITVDLPSTILTDNLTLTYTLTVANSASTPFTATATGTVNVFPRPVLTANTFTLSPASITGSLTPALGTTLPGLSSPSVASNAVGFAISGCGTGSVAKIGGGAVSAGDLNNAISFAAPASASADNKTCTYTLTVANAATTPSTATATGTLTIVPQPVLASTSLLPAPAAVTGGSTAGTTVSIALPANTVAGSTSSVTFTMDSGSGPASQPKHGGGAVGASDLGKTITFDLPGTNLTDSLTLTYTLTVANSASTPFTATASGAVTVLPRPVLAPNTFTLSPAAITGSLAPTLATTLPALTSPAVASNVVAFTISNCGTGSVSKAGGGAVGAADLNTAITFGAPATVNTDNKTCTYTLTVSNAATAPATATATGTLLISPQPGLASGSLVPAPAVVTGGVAGTLSIPLPAKTAGTASNSIVTLTMDNGSGPVAQGKHGGGGFSTADLGTTVTVDLPVTQNTDSLILTYQLTVANLATTPSTASASGTVTVVPKPTLGAGSFAIAPAAIPSNTTPSLSTTLPALTSAPGAVSSVGFAISNCGTGAVSKTNGAGGAIVLGDLGTAITFASPASAATDSKICTYTLSVSNSAGFIATATGTLTLVPVPVFAGALTIVPNYFPIGANTTQLKFALPGLSTNATPASIALTVTPAGGATTAVTKHGGVALLPGDLGTTVNVDVPTTTAGAASLVFTYSLTATSSLAATSTAITATATSLPAGGNLASARVGGTATLLPNGKVLLVGGGDSTSQGVCSGATNTAEIYDPAAGVSTATGTNMTVNRCLHTAVMGANGKVYVMGGANDLHIDVFTPGGGAGTWQSTGLPQLQQVRAGHSATLLGSASGSNSGKIVVAGGYDPTNSNAGIANLELFDPAAAAGNGASVLYAHSGGGGTSSFSTGRGEHAAALAGSWLYFIGGLNPGSGISSNVDALDTTLPANNGGNGGQIKHTATPTNAVARFAHSAIALSSTSILVAGGADATFATLTNMQLYTVDASTGSVTAVSTAQDLNNARARFALLAAGPINKYLVLGGTTAFSTTAAADTATNSIEVIDTSGTLAATNLGTLKSARQALAAVNLALSSASSFVFLVSGGAAATGGAELLIGP